MTPGRFAGQVAVLTGGASGLGLAIARRLRAEGARLILWDANAGALAAVAAEFGDVATERLDVLDADAVERAAAGAGRAFGRIDVLIASAGITGPNATTWEYPPADWRRVIDVNLVGAYHTVRAVAPVMRRADRGRIVAIASVAGKEGNPLASAYSASKAGLIGLIKSLGKELADTGIRANAIAPAAVETPLFDQMTPAHVAFMKSRIPLGRFGTPEEVAAMACWVASEECSFTTGAVFDLSGGRATY